MSAPAISLSGLTHRYGERTALDDVTFDVGGRELFGLLGPNGGGKTTLFRVVTTLMRHTSGTVSVLGNSLPGGAAAVREGLGVVFQSTSLDPHLRVVENLTHQGHLYGLRGSALRARIDEVMQEVAVEDRARDLVRELSGGLKRRVEIAKGLLHRPRLLLLDEPTTGLDPGARRDVWDHLARLRDTQGVACLVTTHLMEEAERCDRVAILGRGRLVALGTPNELRRQVGGDVVTLEPAETGDLAALRAFVAEELGVEMTSVGGVLRANGDGALVARLLDACGDRATAVSVGRPTLEDVFLERTGSSFAEEAAQAQAEADAKAAKRRRKRS